jgi:hypothetical protein
MFYLISPDSDVSIAEQIAQCETFVSASAASRRADALKALNGQNREVLEIRSVYTTQTFDEAHRAALDVPHMARD